MTIAPPEPPTGRWLSRRRARVVATLEARGTYRRWVLVTALAGMFSTSFPITVLTVSLGDIAEEFGTTETVIGWVISLPLLLSALALPILGKLGDLRGHRRVFLVGFALATATAALTATAWNAPTLIGWRTLSQVIGAATQPTSMALIMAVFPAAERVKAMGWWSMVAAGAPAVGLAVGGPLIEALGWPVLFLMQAVLSAAALAIALVVLRETPRGEPKPFDVAGSAALALGTGGLMLALTQGTAWGLDHPVVLAALVTAPVGFGLFVIAERRAVAPLLPLPMLARREFAAPVVASLFTGAAYMGGFFLAPLLLRTPEFGYTVGTIALIMILRPIVYSSSSPLGGHVATRIGERTTAVTGSLVLTSSMVVFAVGSITGVLLVVLGALVLQGLGHGLNRPSISASLANAVDESDLGIAAASERMMFQIGSSFGITVLTVVYRDGGGAADFALPYLVGAGLAAVAAVACWFIRSTDRGGSRLADRAG